MPKRKYRFPLPHELSGFETVGAKAQYAHLIERLPDHLRQKVDEAGFFSPLTITAEDLDSLPDDLYHELAAAAGLSP